MEYSNTRTLVLLFASLNVILVVVILNWFLVQKDDLALIDAYGSFFGGLGSSLALFWIILTCCMQWDAIKKQDAALKMQSKALVNQIYSESIVHSMELCAGMQRAIIDDLIQIVNIVYQNNFGDRRLKSESAPEEVITSLSNIVRDVEMLEISVLDIRVIKDYHVAIRTKLEWMGRIIEEFTEPSILRELIKRPWILQATKLSDKLLESLSPRDDKINV